MGRYISDQNKVVGLFESGTYGTTLNAGSTFWIGQITENSIDDSEGLNKNYYLGTSSRSYGEVTQGPQDITGTLTYNLQDGRMLAWAIGSFGDASGTQSAHSFREIDTSSRQSQFVSGTGDLNPPLSFTLEDSKQSPGTGKNFIRTVNGAVINSMILTATQGEKVQAEINYLGQTGAFKSGTTSSITEPKKRPFLWSDVTLTVAGSTITTAKEISLEINQNVEGPHYLNGSRTISVPFPGNREYMLSISMDLDADQGNLLYDDLYKNNGSFNCTLDLNADDSDRVGSQHITLYMSGCQMLTTPTIPSPSEGINEATFEIVPRNINGSSWDSMSGTHIYGSW